jgi:hypothetical protein
MTSISKAKMNCLFVGLLLMVGQHLCGQQADSLRSDSTNVTTPIKVQRLNKSYHFNAKQLLLPATLVSIGLVGLGSDWLVYQNHEIRDELQEGGYKHFPIDDYSQFAPIAAVYGLNLFGVKGLHNFGDRTLIIAAASIMMTATVRGIKGIARVRRPDGGKNSFPSGHTATAFMAAEFLWQEYRDVSPWIGVAGFAVAAGTGFLRLYNNQHWLTDVIAGAGIGILSTHAAYWLFPCMQRLFHPKKSFQAFAFPQISTHNIGIGCVVSF